MIKKFQQTIKAPWFKIGLGIVIFTIISTCAPRRVRGPFKPKPCLECHSKKLGEFKKAYIHSPMEKKDCEACHLRHGRLPVKSLKERGARL
ncbi:MAG TPA: hypothetical protein EYP21_10355, partial [Syntrophaceae bacterium]|nr:hypothetical protein [Syntrophaceae bacterium]